MAVQAGLPYNLMHKLPQKSINQLHQLNVSLSAAASISQQQQQQQYQQQPSHEHAAHLAAHPHLMQYPSHHQALHQQQHVPQHLLPQTQIPHLAQNSSAYGPLRYIQVGSGGLPAQQRSADQMGDVQQGTDGGEDWVEQVLTMLHKDVVLFFTSPLYSTASC